MALTPPTCASDFIYNASWASNCYATYPCLCSDENFLTTVRDSIRQYCNAADQQLWAQYFAQNCPGVSIFSTSTTVSNSQATATAGVTFPPVTQPISPSPSKSIFTPSQPTIPTAFSTDPTPSTSTTFEISPTTTSAPLVSQGSAGLSTGDKAAIASAVIAGVAIISAVLLVIYRRRLEVR